jgi:uncharacterized repeat protein (TIGR02543 family)
MKRITVIILTLALTLTCTFAIPLTASAGTTGDEVSGNTVTFNANGGKGLGVTQKSVTPGKAYGTLPEPYKAGYLFDGWYTDKTNGDRILSKTVKNAGDSSVLYAHWIKSDHKVKIEIVKWKLKSKVTVTCDLTKASQINGLLKTEIPSKYTFKRYGSNCIYTYAIDGQSDYWNVKVGTATLSGKAPENMVINLGNYDKYNSSNGRTYKNPKDACFYFLICYKGKTTADVYGTFNVKIHTGYTNVKLPDYTYVEKNGKTVAKKIAGTYTVKKAKLRKFKYGNSYNAAVNPRIIFANELSNEYDSITGGNVDPKKFSAKLTLSKEKAAEGYASGYNGTWNYGYLLWYKKAGEAEKFDDNTSMFYSKSRGIAVSGVPIDKKVKVVVKNKKATFSAKTDKSNKIYKACIKKGAGKYSRSCNDTALEIRSNAKSGYPVLALPSNQALTGDFVYEPGHEGTFLGSGRQFNGSVSLNKTYFGHAPLWDSVRVGRTPYNIFRYSMKPAK